MNIIKLLVVVFIAALCDNVGASQLRGMHNDTKLMDQKFNLDDIGNIIRNIIAPIIDILSNNTRPINTTMPTLPNNTSPAPPEGGLVETVPSLAPSLAPEGEASNSTEAPLSGGIIGVAPFPLTGGIVGVAPSPIQEGKAINGTEPPLSGGIIASPSSSIVTEAPVSGGVIGVAPSLPPIGRGAEPPLSGDAIGVAPSLLPIGGGTEPPLSGGDAIGVAPSLLPIGGGTEPPLSGGDDIGVAPSLLPIGGGTEPPLSSGDAIGVAPSLLPIGGGTEPPLSGGGVIGVVPPPQSREAPATNDIESSIDVNIRMSHVSTEGGILFTTNNFGNEDGSNGGSGKEP